MEGETLQFGKIIKQDSYFKGELKSSKTEYSIPESVETKDDVLREVLSALDLITSGKTCSLTIVIDRDKLTKRYKFVTRKYMVEVW